MNKDIILYEQEIENITKRIVSEYNSSFESIGMVIDNKGLSRHGEIDLEDYTSEIEIFFNSKGKFDFIDVYNEIVVFKGKKNFNIESYTILLKKEIDKILNDPGGDCINSDDFNNIKS